MKALAALLFSVTAFASGIDWVAYGRDAGGTRYSPLAQITRRNVSRLTPAWEYHTGALKPETALNRSAAFEATPIVVDGTLYLSTPFSQVIALDPATGRERWVFDPKVDRTAEYSEVASRGVSTWLDSQRRDHDPCTAAHLRGHHRRAVDRARRRHGKDLRRLSPS